MKGGLGSASRQAGPVPHEPHAGARVRVFEPDGAGAVGSATTYPRRSGGFTENRRSAGAVEGDFPAVAGNVRARVARGEQVEGAVEALQEHGRFEDADARGGPTGDRQGWTTSLRSRTPLGVTRRQK